jgi:hypothetical protein
MKHLKTVAVACVAIASFAWLTVQATPMIYPAKGQSAAQTDHDKFACFEWSKAQSGFDPMQAPVATPAPTANSSTNSSTAGMVKGAAGGAAVAELADRDAGKGAAVGVLGAALRERMKQQQSAQTQQAARAQQQRSTFDRAFGACMEGRGYVVK